MAGEEVGAPETCSQETLDERTEIAGHELSWEADRAGKGQMVIRATDRQTRRDEQVAGALGDAVRDRDGDDRVGGEREMRPMLLQRSQRDEHVDVATDGESPGGRARYLPQPDGGRRAG
jgi:hypothetical protein